jgi:hypothetical protein
VRRFKHRLALALGKTLGEIDTMPSRELTRWMVYDQFDPIGNVREDLHAAQICQTIAGVNTPKGKPVPKLEQFVLQFKSVKAKMSAGQLKQALLATLKPVKKGKKG